VDEEDAIAFDGARNVWLATAAGLQRTMVGQAMGP
jgi:hypothetical protein